MRGWEYIPFNGGPRICIGREFLMPQKCRVLTRVVFKEQMALMTASYAVVRLLQHFERIEDVDVDEIVKTNLGLTLSPANGTLVKLFRARSG